MGAIQVSDAKNVTIHPSHQTHLLDSVWMMIGSMIGSLIVLFALMWKARSTPLNYGLLALFTLLEGHLVGTVGKTMMMIQSSIT